MTATEELRRLAIEIDGEVEHFRQLQSHVAEARARLPTAQPEVYDLRSVAMLLTEIYTGAENLMRRIASRLGESIPSGAAWHQELLVQFSVEVPELRPSLFAPRTRVLLDEFRRFRHVTHHVYALQFDWEQMSKLLSQANELLSNLVADAEAFKAFLVAAGDGAEHP
jgi:hypothetical protein